MKVSPRIKAPGICKNSNIKIALGRNFLEDIFECRLKNYVVLSDQKKVMRHTALLGKPADDLRVADCAACLPIRRIAPVPCTEHFPVNVVIPWTVSPVEGAESCESLCLWLGKELVNSVTVT